MAELIWTRPNNTTPYTAGDVVGSSTSANLRVPQVGAPGVRQLIQSAELIINNTSPPAGMTGFTLQLWRSEPAAILDNAAFSAAAANRQAYAGSILINTVAAIGGGFVWGAADYVGRPIRLAGGDQGFWFNLVTLGGYTPAAQTEYTVRFHPIAV